MQSGRSCNVEASSGRKAEVHHRKCHLRKKKQEECREMETKKEKGRWRHLSRFTGGKVSRMDECI